MKARHLPDAMPHPSAVKTFGRGEHLRRKPNRPNHFGIAPTGERLLETRSAIKRGWFISASFQQKPRQIVERHTDISGVLRLDNSDVPMESQQFTLQDALRLSAEARGEEVAVVHRYDQQNFVQFVSDAEPNKVMQQVDFCDETGDPLFVLRDITLDELNATDWIPMTEFKAVAA
jgi:hypothetical protein